MAKKTIKNFMDTPEDFAAQLNEWLKEAEGGRGGSLYRTESMEDYRFYAGNQDTPEVVDALIRLKRPVTTYNEVKPKIDMLVGLGAQMKQIPFPAPTQTADVAISELMGGVFRHYRNKINASRTELSCFEHMVKGGLSYQHYYVDADNPFKPAIKTERVDGRDCWTDPTATDYAMESDRFFFRDKWLSKETLEVRYPDVPLDQMRGLGTMQTDLPAYYDSSTELYRIVECWFRHLDSVMWFINPITQKEEWLLPKAFKEFEKTLREGINLGDGQVFQLDPTQSLDGVASFKKNVYYALFVEDSIIESGPTPYQHDMFPYIQYGAYKDEDNNRWFGPISMMKDPQRNLNTMRRQLTHLLQTAPRGILMHEVGSILNIEDYEKRGADPTFHMELAKGQLDKVKFSSQPQISPVYEYLDGMNAQGMKDSSGIQDSLMGVQTTSREPGVAVQMRQEQNIAVLHVLFSNYKESRRIAAKQLLSLIQQYVTEPEVIRIEGQEGMELLQINTEMNPQNEGFNAVSTLEFDIVVDEDIESSSSRLATMRMLTDFSVANPGTIPPDVLLEYGNVPMTVTRRVMEFFEKRRAEDQALELARINSKTQGGGNGNGGS